MAGQSLVRVNLMRLYQNGVRRLFAVTCRQTGWFKESFCNGINTNLSIYIYFFEMRLKTERGAGLETLFLTLLVVDIGNNVRSLGLLGFWTSPSSRINTKYIFEFQTRRAVPQNHGILNFIYQG
jgi:hypothetical protein